MRSGRNDRSISTSEIRFYDNYRPLLGAGDYTLDVEQQIDSTDRAHPLSKSATMKQPFSVAAPRFALADAEVQQRFPPLNANGVFAQNLPHVVLMERALPWERSLSADGSVPWLALLVFTEDELIRPTGQADNSALANATLLGSYPVTELLTPKESGTLGPNVTAQTLDETACRAIDMTTAVFTRVTPRLHELPYLAHARQVNVENKATALASTDGWFSAVIANRFPAASADGVRNIVHLVSLEGFAPYLVDSPAWPTGITKVRLAALASWSFTARERGGNFRSLMLNLVDGQATGGDGLRLQLPVPATPVTPGSAGELAKKALGQGYAALQYQTRAGDQGFAWYHGPFVPHPVAPLAAGTHPFASSAAATVYDQTTGTFDLSYATAWEIGRLLALSDRAYAENRQRSRQTVRRLANLLRERTRWQEGARMLSASSENDSSSLDELLDPQHVSRSFTEWLGDAVGEQLPKEGRLSVAPVPAPPRMLRKDQGTAVAQVQRLLERRDVKAVLGRQTAAAMATNGPMRSVAGWLGELRLLNGIPFAHLVPHAQMLPAESIRFFYVDPNYLDAMCDGAQSVGVQSSRDAMEQGVVRGAIRDQAIRHGRQFRATLTHAPMNANAQPGDPVAGVLLRSSVVSGWPGLEIKAFATADRSSPIDPVRIDPIGDDVLMALFPRVPAWIEIDEPKEGLAFGVAAAMAVDLRRISGGDIGKVFKTVSLTPQYLRATSRVVNVDGWQKFLATQVTPASLWGPAAFALQMVSAPLQMIFQNGKSA
jgi:hypothetical protein